MDAVEVGEGVRQRHLHRRLFRARLLARFFGDLLGRADAGDHVLALRVDEKLAVEFLLAGRWIARKSDAGRRGLAHIAKNHGLHVNCRAPAFRNAIQAPIGDRALVHPRAEHGADGAPQLRVRILRKRLTLLLLDALLVADDKLLPVGGLEVGVERVAVAVLVLVEDFLEVMVRDAEHHVRVHGDKAPVAVIGEPPVAGLFRERRDGHVVEAEIEHRVQHARHRSARAGAHRDEQRIFAIAEFFPGDAADVGERSFDLPLQILRIGFVVLVKIRAHLGADGEAGWHRQAETRHLGEAGALAAKQIAHVGAALRLAAAEGVDPFALGRRLRRRRSGCGFG